jgi:hypothetical protein
VCEVVTGEVRHDGIWDNRGPRVLIWDQGSEKGIQLDTSKGIEWNGGHSKGLQAWEERNCQK